MPTRRIKNSWWVDITHNNIRYRRKSPQDTKAGAQAFEMTLRRKLAEGVSLTPDPEQKLRKQKFREFAEFWFKTHVMVHNKPSMIYRTRGILDGKLVPFFGNTSIGSISTLQVERYKAKAASTGLSNKTINCELSVLGRCLRDAKRWFNLERIPDIALLKLPPANHDFLREQECDLLLSALDGLWYDIVYTALKTGMRLGELRSLSWNDVQIENKTLTVRRSWCAISKQHLSPKGNSVRTIPLPEDVVQLLARRCGKGPLVFSEEGEVFSSKHLNAQLERACKSVGLRRVTCHVLRHSYASTLAMKGAPIIVIQRLLGHTDIKVTMRYAHISKSSLAEVIELIGNPYSVPKSGLVAIARENDMPSFQGGVKPPE